jgi:outer membrane receptor protein involved in Fe transport
VFVIKPVIFFCLLSLGATFVQGQSQPSPKAAKDTIPIRIDSLKAAIVTATMRPRVKGDTLEYNVEHMKTHPNMVVEELLRRLPGLRIDADGTITYNGEKIQHLLVDGEDIFGSDPTMVTRNFDASKIARVQILERKSDQAIFTGVDDGTRTKTLNLVMKETAKDGYFGKVEAGGNAQGYYNANGALAAFRKKQQFTAMGISANTGVLGFSSNASGANVGFLNGNTDALGASAGTGIPRFTAGALHYANTWSNPGDHLTANYQYSHYFTEPMTTTQTFQTQQDSIYGQAQKSQSINQQDQHWLYAICDWALTSATAFRLTFHGSNSQGQNQFGAAGSSTFNDTLVNSNQRTIHDKVSRQNVGGDLSWQVRIGKQENQIFSINAGATKIDLTTNGYLYSLNQFYQPNGRLQSVDTVDQRKQIASHSLSIGGSANYTQPLWKGAVLGLSYGLYQIGDDPLQATFTRGDGKYQDIVDSLSTHFKTQVLSQRATINLQGKSGPLSYTVGNDWLGYSYWQQDLIGDSVLHLHYSNLAPRLILNYTVNQATNFNFNYNATTQEPSITQLAPVTNNTDPLHINLGNPDLKPGFSQNFKLDFHRFKIWLVNLNLNLTLTSNSISNKTTTDSLGRQISQPVNVNGGRTAGVNFSLDRKILGFDAGFHTSGNFSRTVSFINADLSDNDAYTGGGGLSLNKFVEDKFSLQLYTNFTYLTQTSSINTTAPVRYWTQNHFGGVTIYLLRDFEFNTNATYTWQEKTSVFSASTSVLLWNSYVSRNLIHNKLVIKAQLNNILNANSSISRTNTDNINTQSSTNVLGRYWMVSAIFHFDQKFKKK